MALFTTDPGTDIFLRGIDAGERARRNREQVSVDTAIRAGLAQQQGAAAPPLSPASAQAPVSAPAPATATGAPPPPPPPPPAPPLAPPAAPEPPGGSGVPDSIPPAAEPPQAAWPPAQATRPATSAPRAPAPALTPGPSMPTAGASSPYLAPTMGGPGGDRYGAILQNLSQAPGGGVAALGIMREQDRVGVLDGRRRDQLGRLAMMAFAKGDVVTGQYFAAQGGLALPQGFGAGMGRGGRGGGGGAGGTANVRMLGTGSLMAQRLYGNNPQQAAAFLQTFISSGGSVEQAVAAAGDPSGKFQKHVWGQGADGQAQLFGVTTDGRSVPINDDDGKPITRAPNPQRAAGAGGGGGQRDFAIDRKYGYLVQSGMEPAEAARVAGGGALSANGKAQILMKIQKDVTANYVDFDTPAKQGAEIRRRVAEIEGLLGGGQGATPPQTALPQAQRDPAPALLPGTPAPANPAPAAAPAAPAAAPTGAPRRPASVPHGSAYSASRNQWRGPDGTIYDANGQRQ